MKFTISLLGIIFLLFTQMFFLSEKAYADANEQGYKNIYGIAWHDKPAEDMKYAKQMGYDYIAIHPSSSPKEYHTSPNCTSLKFYLIDPQLHPQVLSGYNKDIDTTEPISEAAKNFYNHYMVWKSNDQFPQNLAMGHYPTGTSTKFSVMWDFQQQAVIDEIVEKTINLAKSYEDTSLPFAFGGYIINEPRLAGEFYRLDETGDNIPVSLSYWTGANSGLVHGAIAHEYATYSEGRTAFYKQLFKRTREEWHNVKIVMETYDIYNNWIKEIKDRIDKNELMPDVLFQGRANTAFVNDVRIFDTGLIRKDEVGITQSNRQGEYKNRLFAAKAGVNGSWYNWFGRFGGTGDMPDFQNITEVYPRLKLIRCVPNWDNLNGVLLAERSWDGGVYQSTKSYASGDVMYSHHPKTGKLFAVFLTLSGAITLNAGETVTSVERTDGFFVESGDGRADVNIAGNEIRLKSRKDIGKGYIFTLSSLSEGNSSTGLETDETSGSEASNVGINTGGVSRTTWYKYGEARGASSSIAGEKNGKTNVLSAIKPQATSTQAQWQKVAKRTQAQKTAGLSGGEGWQMIFGIQYAPTNPDIVYFVTDTNQVWKTINANDANPIWNRKANGFLAAGGISLAVDPTDENIVYVAGSLNMDGVNESVLNPVEGIFRTTDGGDSWTLVTSYSHSTYGPQAHFHRSARGGNHIAFAGTSLYAAPSTGGLLKSTNGTTWTRVSKNGGGYVLDTVECRNISIHPSSVAGSATCFVSATNGLWRIRDNNGSATVTQIGSGLPSYPYQIAFGTSTPNIIYAADGTNGVYRSTNGGVTFSARNNGLSSPISSGGSAKHIVMSPVDANRLFVTFQGLFGRHLYYTNDGGANWTQTSNMDEQNADGWVCGSTFGYTSNISGINSTTTPIACHPKDPNIALVNGWGSQVKKTTDGGVTWKYAISGYIGATESQYGSVPIGWDSTNSNRATFFHMDFGPMITTDGESTFKNIKTEWNGREASLCGAMRGNIIVAAFGPNENQRIHVSRDSGASWTPVSGADGNFFFAAFHPQNSNIVYAGGYAPDGSKLTYKFTNIQTDNTYTTLTKNVSGIFKGDGDIVYSAKGDNLIYKSTNGGITWTAPYPYIGSGNVVRQIAIDPTNENRIYAAVQGKGVYIITDTAANGGTVLLKNEANGLALSQFGSVDTYAIVTDPNNSNVVYTGAQRTNRGQANGVFRSTDSGASWTNINGNIGSHLNVVNLSVNPHNSYVYLDSYSGTWKMPPPSTSTADTTAPNCTVSINSGAAYTKSTAVTLTLSATDNVGVTGYYLSTSSTKPLTSATGWTSITSTTNYTGNVSYTLSSGDGSKTVYVWYKDAAGNVSNTASDSITLDMTVPTITITSPTSSATYTTTSSTINLSGSASDSTSVSSVTWSNSKGGSGTASGTTSWSISSISLSIGDNVITVTAKDGVGNTGNDTITVSFSGTTNTTGPQAFYRFDEGGGTIVYDSSGNGNNGAINGATWTSGKIGSGLGFDGVDDYVEAPDSPSLNITNEITVSAWVYYVENNKYQMIISKPYLSNSNTSPYASYSLYINPSSFPGLWMTIEGVGRNLSSSVALSSGTWNHIVGTYDGSMMKIYINGQLKGSTQVTGSITTYAAPLRLGTNGGYIEMLNGTLDECRIYNRALSGQEVHELYDGLQAWYKFDEGSGTVAVDASVGGNNGAINGATWTTGKNGGGLGFDGMNDYVQASESTSLNISGNAITLSTWVNYRDTNKHQIFIAKPFNASSHLSPYFSYSLHGLFVNSTQLKPRFWLSIGGTGKSITSSELISPESWYHIVGVYDGSTMKIYVNGVERGSIAVSGNIKSYAIPLRLGANGGFTQYFSGAIDDVRIYNKALSDQEVQNLYTNGTT